MLPYIRRGRWPPSSPQEIDWSTSRLLNLLVKYTVSSSSVKYKVFNRQYTVSGVLYSVPQHESQDRTHTKSLRARHTPWVSVEDTHHESLYRTILWVSGQDSHHESQDRTHTMSLYTGHTPWVSAWDTHHESLYRTHTMCLCTGHT
jgi:hypothetical protein